MSILNRRQFLHALGLSAGSTLLGIMERSLIGEARAAAPPAKRFILVTYGNGLHAERYRTTVRSQTDYDLPAIFAPLAPYKGELLILKEFYNPHNQELHGNGWATLSVMPSPRSGGDEDGANYRIPSGISLDRLLARELGAQTPFPSINLGLLEEFDYVPHVSADGPGRPFPAERSPVTAYRRLFGSFLATSGESAEQLLARKRSVLDFVQADIRRLQDRLAGRERQKLEQYLDSVRAMEASLARLGQVKDACGKPAAPDAKLDTAQTSRGPVLPEVVGAHVEVAANALMCGLTRVAALSIFGGSFAHNRYEWLGDTKGHHQQCHDKNNPMIASIDTFVASQVASLWAKLKAVPEGNGTMADSSLLLLMNSGGGKHHNGWNSHAALLLGNAGGALRSGRYLSYASGKHCISDLFVSIANAMGLGISTFGDAKYCMGPLPGLT